MELTKQEQNDVKTVIETGMSFMTIARALQKTSRPQYSEEQLQEAVMQLANYTPENPAWQEDKTIHTSDRDIVVAYRHPCPSIMLLDNVLSHDECDEIIVRGRPRLERSKIRVGNQMVTNPRRMSETGYLNRGEDEFVQRIDQRCAEIMHSPVNHGESLQIVRYTTGGEYRPHYDYFNETEAGGKNLIANGGNRTATLLMYLNDVEGKYKGQTYFPGLGLRIRPQKGSAIYFHYTNSKRQFDPQTFHGGEELLAGEKWIVTKWAREHEHTPRV